MKKLLLILSVCMAVTLLFAATPHTLTPRQQSLQRLVQRADSGNPAAQFSLSSLIERGEEGFAPDTLKALSLLKASAASGYAPAQNYLGYAYAVPLLGLSRNADSTLYWIEKAALSQTPDPKAFNNLGMLLLNGSYGVKKDIDKARYWLERGAEKGVPTAQASLARLYLEGIGVTPDTIIASELLHKAAAAGLHDAGEMLAQIVLEHADTLSGKQALELAQTYYHERIFPVAIPLLWCAIDTNEPLAFAIMAQCAAEGIGIPYDYTLAIDLYAKAAALGDPHAQFILAETMQTFPDLIEDLQPRFISIYGQPLPDIETLYKQAAAQGITDAPQALAPLRP